MFKFNFSKEDNEEDVSEEVENEKHEWLESEEIFPGDSETVNNESVHEILCGTLKFLIVSSDSVKKLINEENLDENIKNEMLHSDLIPAVYEGGYKVWECTHDLLEFLQTQPEDMFLNKKVLDLGCGSGLLGIYAALHGATVHFQDYNVEVIKNVTIHNVHLNLSGCVKENSKSYRYFCGDWSSFLKITDEEFSDENIRYDYILSSETIYNVENHQKLYNVMKKRLKNNGVIYLAAKTHYFGVGGSTLMFQNLLKKEDLMESKVCWKCTGGVQREILEIKFKHQPHT